MEVKQIYSLVNDITKEVLGKENLINEDLSNVVDLGTELFNSNAVDAYVKSLVNHIGRVIFVNRSYRGSAPSVLMDGWEYGSVLEKIQADMPEATENETWELEDGTSYDPNIFYQPKVSAKFFNKKTTFEVPSSFTDRQVKQSFSNAGQLNAFMSLIYNSVDKSMTVKTDSLIMRTIDNMIGETIHADYGSGAVNASSHVRAINLLYLYNQLNGTDLTFSKCFSDINFLKFASYTISLYLDRIGKMSVLFNVGGKERFTPRDMLHLILHTDFARASDIYLQSDTYHNELVALPNYERVPYWQGTGTSYSLIDTTKIDVTTSGGNQVSVSGIIGVMFDRDALGVCNMNRRVTTNYNPKAEFYSNWYKFDCQYFNDLNENMIVFLAQ